MSPATKVLICGAGPTGLMMACQLKRFGVDCIIIDSKEGPVKESRALAVQARTLQIYEQMNIASAALQRGNIAGKGNIIIRKKRVEEISFENIGKGLSAFPFLFILEQDKNEELLLEHLKASGGTVHWQHTLLNFTQDSKGVTAVIEDETGHEQSVTADWLVGADGAKSVVRHLLQVPFSGDTYENIFYVADTAMQWPWGHDGINVCLSSQTFMAVFPMQGQDRYRVIGIFPKGFRQEDVKQFSDIQAAIEKQVGLNLYFTDPRWFSVYKLHHRCVDQFRVQNVFLAGDAAHVHSPVGGQGMNTGLQDAYNLAWKLSAVIKGQADEDLLNSYNEERLPLAQALVNTTDRAFSMITSASWPKRFFRLYILPILLKLALQIPRLRTTIYRAGSQIGINYQKSSLSFSEDKHLIEAGSLVPFVNINSKLIDAHLKFEGFTILLFDTILPGDQMQDLEKAFANAIQFIQITRNENNEAAFEKFCVKRTALFVIRPDNYIAFASETISLNAVRKYLRERMLLKIMD